MIVDLRTDLENTETYAKISIDHCWHDKICQGCNVVLPAFSRAYLKHKPAPGSKSCELFCIMCETCIEPHILANRAASIRCNDEQLARKREAGE